MRKILFCLIVLSCALGVSAQNIRFRVVGAGKISVSIGKFRSVIDLSKEVAGCAAVAGKFRRDLEAKGCAASPATLKLINSQTKNNQNFLVLQSEAMGNCNVCGQCGASEAFSLIWLKLDARLRVIEKKSVPIEYCLENISIVGSALSFDEEKQDSALSLKFIRDVLTVEYEKKLFSDVSDSFGYDFSHLEYNRKTPEKGFVIKTEKRVQSSEN
jgi:hypothetical protein